MDDSVCEKFSDESFEGEQHSTSNYKNYIKN